MKNWPIVLIASIIVVLPHQLLAQKLVSSGNIYWWGITPSQVSDSMATKYGWQEVQMPTLSTDAESQQLSFSPKSLDQVYVFKFYRGRLTKRAYMLDINSKTAQSFDSKISYSKPISDDEWLDTVHGLIYSRQIQKDYNLYVVEPDWGDVEYKKYNGKGRE